MTTCPNCNKMVQTDFRACPYCLTELIRTCSHCGKELAPDFKACPYCLTPVEGELPVSETTQTQFCAGSGKVLKPEDDYFKCMECGKLYLECYRFEDQPICQFCAQKQGMDDVLARERARQEAELQARVDAELQTRLEHAEAERRQQEQAEIQAREATEHERQAQRKLGITEEHWIEIPAGEYLMGSPANEESHSENERQHRVAVAAFKLLKTPVTFAMYDAFCEATGRDKPKDQGWGRTDRPVINVSYWDAVDYSHWLSEQTGWQVRLPTEAEWEYACRAGTTTPFWTGNTIATSQANYNSGFGNEGEFRGKTMPVDYFLPNPWGLHDMHGNVTEWCASEYDNGYLGLELRVASGDRTNQNSRALRGGYFNEGPDGLRSACRVNYTPAQGILFIGFRLARLPARPKTLSRPVHGQGGRGGGNP